MKKVVIAIDSFKGCLTSAEANLATAKAIHRYNPLCETLCFPIADGGEGVLQAMIAHTKAQIKSVNVHNPLMQNCEAVYGMSIEKKMAFIEMASASGLTLLSPQERNPLETTSYGTGELIKDAISLGCRNFIIGLGGSATNDAGLGMLQALGFTFYDRNHHIIKEKICGKHLSSIQTISSSQALEALKACRFTAACDVQSPLYGPKGAAYVFAPQKGADRFMVENLDKGLKNIAEVVNLTIHKDFSTAPGTGAAGGMGFALKALLGADLKPGIDLILELNNFKEKIADADLLITGEGKADLQTLLGKVPYGILKVGKALNIPTLLLAGKVEDHDALLSAGFTEALSISPSLLSLEEAMKPETAEENLQISLTEYLKNHL